MCKTNNTVKNTLVPLQTATLFSINWKQLLQVLWVFQVISELCLIYNELHLSLLKLMVMCCSHQRCLVNEGGQSDVTLGQPPTVMCAESDLDLIIDIEPFWVMVHLLRLQSHPGHEAERLIKGFKVKLFEDGVTVLHLHPACSPELHHQLITLRRGEPVGVWRHFRRVVPGERRQPQTALQEQTAARQWADRPQAKH